ncbi:MAG: class I SAM-dependent methyltransferase [Bacteroidetes bacterium]|nr:MAG: class I SAM-dependent methyltransferase [Bacteroidota bacterium]
MKKSETGFDRVAGWYDGLKGLVFGRELDEAVCGIVRQIPANRRILVVGGGTGRSLLPALMHQRPACIHYLEASAGMLARAQAVLPAAAIPLVWQHGTAADLSPDLVFEVVITPFVLDLFPEAELEAEMDHLAGHLRQGGLWLVSDFRQPPGWRGGPARLLIGFMYSFFRLTAGITARHLPAWEEAFARRGYELCASEDRLGGLVRSQIWRKPGPEAEVSSLA